MRRPRLLDFLSPRPLRPPGCGCWPRSELILPFLLTAASCSLGHFMESTAHQVGLGASTWEGGGGRGGASPIPIPNRLWANRKRRMAPTSPPSDFLPLNERPSPKGPSPADHLPADYTLGRVPTPPSCAMRSLCTRCPRPRQDLKCRGVSGGTRGTPPPPTEPYNTAGEVGLAHSKERSRGTNEGA